MSYATGPCRTCGENQWGVRHPKHRTKTGQVRVYESRYCLVCSRRRTAAYKKKRR